MEFNRQSIIPIVYKINQLIEMYAIAEHLEDFLTSEYIHFFNTVNPTQVQPTDLIENTDGDAVDWYGDNKTSISVAKIDFRKYIKSEAIHYNKKIDFKTLSKLDSITYLTSDTQFLDTFQAQYYPEYLQIRNILVMLFYEMPRKINKVDLKLLNSMYKKYKVNSK